MSRTRVAARLVAMGCGLALATGCSVQVTGSGPSAPSTATATAAAPHTPAATTSTSGGTGLDTLVVAAGRPAVRTSATILGDASGTTYDNALSLWAGCDGDVDEVQFDVKGHDTVTGRLGLRASTPRDIVVQGLFELDGAPVQNIQLDGTDPTPPLVDVRIITQGGRRLTLQTTVQGGTCTDAEESYAVLVDGYAL